MSPVQLVLAYVIFETPVKSIRNLTGHTIHPWSIHGAKCVPIVKSNDQTKMEEGDYFAIETFGSTGRGEVHDEGECSHYALMKDAPRRHLNLASAKRLLGTINREFGTLPFARRYLDRVGETNYLLGVSRDFSMDIFASADI